MTEARSNFNNNYVPGLFAVAQEAYKRHSETWKKVYTVRSSSKAYEESSYVSGFGYMAAKPEGTGFTFDERIQGHKKTWNHKTYALACRITEEAIEDDQYGVMAQAMKGLGVSAAATRHLLAIRMLMNAENTDFHTAGDGLCICSDSHVRLDGSTWSNVAAAAAAPTTASVEAAVKNFEAIVDHRGKRYDQKAKSIICGPTHEFTMAKILESVKVAENANNADNTLKSRRSLTLEIEPEITDDRWFVQGEKDPDIGLIWFDRKKPVSRRHGDPDTGDSIFSIYTRFSNERNDPRQIYMVPAA
jgi:phage major head subunit gpT-like protein